MIKSSQSSTSSDPVVTGVGNCVTTSHPVSNDGLSSAALLNGQASVSIDHEGTVYILRATKTGKLILTK